MKLFANSDDRAVAKAHFEAAALHAATYELHMLAGATFVQGDPELAGYYARVGAGESDRAQALSHHALALSMPDARAQR